MNGRLTSTQINNFFFGGGEGVENVWICIYNKLRSHAEILSW